MAGKKQHYIPQFLMRGFASKTVPTKNKPIHYTWFFRNGTDPMEVPVMDVGRQDYFYGKSGVGTADEKITDAETVYYSPLVHELRNQRAGSIVTSPKLCEFIAHLVTRSEYVRQVFRDVGSAAVDEVMTLFSDSTLLAPWLDQSIKKNPDYMAEYFKELFGPDLGEFVRTFLPQTVTPESLEGVAEHFKETRCEMDAVIAPSVKKGHIDGLEQRLAPEKIVEELALLNWFTIDSSASLILGDFGCLLEMNGSLNWSPIPYEHSQIENAYLPISMHRMVVGTRGKELLAFDPELVNEKMARISREFFIAAEKK